MEVLVWGVRVWIFESCNIAYREDWWFLYHPKPQTPQTELYSQNHFNIGGLKSIYDFFILFFKYASYCKKAPD